MLLRRLLLALIVFAGLAARLYLATSVYGNADQQSYDTVRGILDHGGNVYAETIYYNYSPVWMGVLRTADGISDVTGIAYSAAIRSLLTIADLVLALMLARLAGQQGAWNWGAFTLYWLNPGVIAVVGFGGQFETLALIPVVGAVLALRAGKSLGWIFTLGLLAILIKHSMVFLVWAVFIYAVGVRRAVLWMVAAAAIFLLSFAPFLPTGAQGIWENVLSYTSRPSGYGLTAILPRNQVLVLFYSILLLLPLLMKRKKLTDTLRMSSYGYLMFVTGFGPHYTMPALAFSSLNWKFGVVGWLMGVLVAGVSMINYGIDHAFWYLWIWGIASVAFTWGLAKLLQRQQYSTQRTAGLPPQSSV